MDNIFTLIDNVLQQIDTISVVSFLNLYFFGIFVKNIILQQLGSLLTEVSLFEIAFTKITCVL